MSQTDPPETEFINSGKAWPGWECQVLTTPEQRALIADVRALNHPGNRSANLLWHLVTFRGLKAAVFGWTRGVARNHLRDAKLGWNAKQRKSGAAQIARLRVVEPLDSASAYLRDEALAEWRVRAQHMRRMPISNSLDRALAALGDVDRARLYDEAQDRLGDEAAAYFLPEAMERLLGPPLAVASLWLPSQWRKLFGVELLAMESNHLEAVLHEQEYKTAGWERLGDDSPRPELRGIPPEMGPGVLWFKIVPGTESTHRAPLRDWKVRELRGLTEHLSVLSDPRRDQVEGRGRKYPRKSLFTILALARIEGVQGAEAIVKLIESLSQVQRKAIGLCVKDRAGKFSIPSERTVENFSTHLLANENDHAKVTERLNEFLSELRISRIQGLLCSDP